MSTRQFRIPVDATGKDVSAVVVRPRRAACLYVLAHGAGAGMTHPFLAAVAEGLAAHGVATLRYQFPYMEAGGKAPSREPVLTATVRAALAAGGRLGLPVVAGGKSMGGRMTSRLLAREPDASVRGLVFLGFPLHAARASGAERAAHLDDVAAPMLFVQGTRDPLAGVDEMRAVVAHLGARASLHLVEDGDHSFHVRRRSGRPDDDALAEIVSAAARWMRDVVAS